MATFSRIKVWVSNEVLTASDLNGEFDNIINHLTPQGLEDASANVAAMQTQIDPGLVGSESLATTLLGELHRLRYMLSFLAGKAQWYDHSGRSLATNALAVQSGDIVDGAVIPSKFADGSVTTAKLADGAVTALKKEPFSVHGGSSLVPTLVTANNQAEIDIPGATITITTTGRPVKIGFCINGTSSTSNTAVDVRQITSTLAVGVFTAYKQTTSVGRYFTPAVPTSPTSGVSYGAYGNMTSLEYIDFSGDVGTFTYKVTVSTTDCNVRVNPCRFYAYEL